MFSFFNIQNQKPFYISPALKCFVKFETHKREKIVFVLFITSENVATHVLIRWCFKSKNAYFSLVSVSWRQTVRMGCGTSGIGGSRGIDQELILPSTELRFNAGQMRRLNDNFLRGYENSGTFPVNPEKLKFKKYLMSMSNKKLCCTYNLYSPIYYK